MDTISPSTRERKPLLAFLHVSSQLSRHLSPTSTRVWVFISERDRLPVEFLTCCFGVKPLTLVCAGSTRVLDYDKRTGFSDLTCAELGLYENQTNKGFLTALFTGTPVAHKIFECDGCQMAPIVGVKYKCLPLDGCENFDLCENCYDAEPRSSHDPSHQFVAFPLSQRLTFVGQPNVWERLHCALIVGGGSPALGVPALTAPLVTSKNSTCSSSDSSSVGTCNNCSSSSDSGRNELKVNSGCDNNNCIDHDGSSNSGCSCNPLESSIDTRQEGCPLGVSHTPGCYEWMTYLELLDNVIDFAAGMSQLPWAQQVTSETSGNRRHVGLCADNSIEWVIADMACKYLGFVTFTIHVAFSDSQLACALALAECDIVVTSDSEVTKRIMNIANPSILKTIVQIRGDCSCKSAVPVISFASVRSTGKGHCVPPRYLPPEALSTVIFTSGTTGEPKGVMITHEMELDLLTQGAARAYFGRNDIRVIFEPLAWMTARDDVYVSLMRRGCALLYEPARFSLDGLFAELPCLRPTTFKAVPLIFNKFYFEWQTLVQEYKSESIALERMREMKPFGDRLHILVTGGAKTAPKVLQFLRKCFSNVSVVDAMGTTEVGGLLNDNYLLHNVDAKLRDVPSLGYLSSDKPPRGELVVKTRSMTPGYFRDLKTTREKFDEDGWFCTGDIVEKHGYAEYIIIDRVAAVIKLASGEFVSPIHIEECLVGVSNVKEMCLCGGIGDMFLVAVVVIEHKYRTSEADILKSFLDVSRKCSLPPAHLPRRVIQTDQAFSVVNGTLTPTGKLNRMGIARKYKAELEALTSLEHSFLDEQETLVDKVSRISAELLGAPLSSFKDSLREAGFHSELSVRLARRLEAECNVKGSLQHVLAPQASPESIAAALSSTSNTPCNVNVLSDDELFERDRLACTPALQESSTSIRSSQLVCVLLTGATGFVGRYLLSELLCKSDTKIVCIVRAKSDIDARARIESALSQAYLILSPEWSARMEVYAGNIEEKEFGLTSQLYARLSCSVSTIVHCAAAVNWVLPYSSLRAANINGTEQIIAFSQVNTLKEIHHISTISAAPSSRELSGFSSNDYPFLGSKEGYARSKWMSELLLRSHARSGVVVYRLGMCAPAKNGFCISTDMVPRFLDGIACLKVAPDVSGRMEMLPVDIVASLVADVVIRRTPSPHTACTFHVVNDRENFVPWREMINMVNEAVTEDSNISLSNNGAIATSTNSIAILSHSIWSEHVTHRNSPLRPLASFVGSPVFFRDSRIFDNRNFKAVLGISYMPVVDVSLLKNSVRFCQGLRSSRMCDTLACWQYSPCVLHANVKRINLYK